jgi:hypothetical protein
MVTQVPGRKADHMGEHSARPDPAVPGEPGPNDTTWVFSDDDPAATRRPVSGPPSPSGSVSPPPGDVFQRPPAEAAFYPQADVSGYPAAPAYPQTELSGYPAAPAYPQTELSGYPAPPGRAPTELSGYPAAAGPPQTELSGYPPAPAGRADVTGQAPPSEVVRYGPGVPATAADRPPASEAERIWRTGPVPEAPRQRPRWRRWAGPAVTVLLLGIAAVVLILRLHHPALAVTAAAITGQSRNGCGVNVTGRIATSGGAGTVSYQWVFRPDPRPPVPLTQTVIAGQKDVFVTVAVEGSGQGTSAQSVTLQVLGPGQASATTSVVVRC